MLLRDLDHGDSLVFDVLLATFIGDTAAYFGGRLWGTRQLAPRVSPARRSRACCRSFLAGTAAFWFAGLYQDRAVGARRATLVERLRGGRARSVTCSSR